MLIDIDIYIVNDGLVDITVIFIVRTGIVGTVFVLKYCKTVQGKISVGLGICNRTCSHVIGTAKAVETGDMQA